MGGQPAIPVGMGMGMGMLASKPKVEDLHQKESSEIYEGAEHNNLQMLQAGISGGGDVNTCNLQGVTPLLLAVKNQNVQIINTLLSAGASINAVSADTSPVHEAIRQKNLSILTTLLDKGGQVNLQLVDGKTPLHVAIQQNNPELINFLLSRGADPKAKTQQNVSCLHFAAAEGDRDTVEKFIGHGNNVNEQNANGKTPLHVAVEKTQLDAVKVLLNHGANTNLKDAWGRPAKECGGATAYKLIHAHKPGQKYEFVVVTDDDLKTGLPSDD